MTIDEGIEILTGKKAGVKGKNGKYPKGTINYLVSEKLDKYSKKMSPSSEKEKKGSKKGKSKK